MVFLPICRVSNEDVLIFHTYSFLRLFQAKRSYILLLCIFIAWSVFGPEQLHTEFLFFFLIPYLQWDDNCKETLLLKVTRGIHVQNIEASSLDTMNSILYLIAQLDFSVSFQSARGFVQRPFFIYGSLLVPYFQTSQHYKSPGNWANTRPSLYFEIINCMSANLASFPIGGNERSKDLVSVSDSDLSLLNCNARLHKDEN